MVAEVTPSWRWKSMWPVNSSVLLPDQPNQRPRYSLRAAESATARPAWAPPSPRCVPQAAERAAGIRPGGGGKRHGEAALGTALPFGLGRGDPVRDDDEAAH